MIFAYHLFIFISSLFLNSFSLKMQSVFYSNKILMIHDYTKILDYIKAIIVLALRVIVLP